MPRALVTGATGLVGSHVVERLAADGWATRVLTRDPSSAQWLARRGAELERGDALDAAAFERAARGCEAVFHAAALIAPLGREPWERFRAVNVDATTNAVAAAAAHGARLLFVSSVAVYGPTARYRAVPTDESAELAPLGAQEYYARSKRAAEAVVLEAHAAGRVWATAVRPCVIYGPRDRQFVPRAAKVCRYGVVPIIAGGRSVLAIVHAANVADGAVRAVACDAAGGRAYNLANDFDVSVAEFVRLAGVGLGRRVRTVRLPAAVARGALRVACLTLRAVGAGGLASHLAQTSLFLSRDNPFTSERARRELGWTPTVRPELGIPEAFAWWKAQHR